MAFTEEQLALVSQYSPSYKSSLASESKAVNDRRMEMEQAKQRAQYMTDNKGDFLGNKPKLGLPSEGKPSSMVLGSLAYADGVDPRQTQLMERNFAMNTSGMPKLMEQGLSDSSSMQGDIMSMVKDEYKAGYTPRKADTSLEQLTQYRDRVLASGGDTTDVDNAIAKASQKSGGVQLTTGADGSVSFSMGGPEGMAPITKTQQNKIQDKRYNATERLDELSAMSNSLDNDFLTWQGKAKEYGLSLAEKFGVDLKPEQQDYVQRFGEFRANSVNNLAQYIKSISGAAVTEEEAKRLTKGLPNADDSVSQYKGKMRAVRRQAKFAIIRSIYAEKSNMNPLEGDISIWKMEDLYNRRGDALLEKMIGQGMTKEEARPLVFKQLKEEFGA